MARLSVINLTPEQTQELLDGPAGTPPAGVSPNFENPPNLHVVLILTLTLALVFGTLAVIMRTHTKLLIIRSFVYEDYAILIGWALAIAGVLQGGIGPQHVYGRHIWDLQLKAYTRMLYWKNVVSIIYCPIMFLIKLSILLQYLRIFVPNRKGNMCMFIAIHILIWSCFLMYLASALAGIFEYIPRERIWNKLMTSGHCIDNTAAYLATTTFNVISDFAILILPMPSVWKLQMPRKRKILTTAVFATGSLACVTSILRSYYAGKIVQGRDDSWNLGRIGLWTYAEISIGTIVSCLPVLPKFFQHFVPKLCRTTPSRSKSVSNPPHASWLPCSREKSRDSTKPHGHSPEDDECPVISKTWNEPFIPLVEIKEDYLTFTGQDPKPLSNRLANDCAPKMFGNSATRRQDLEIGEDNFDLASAMRPNGTELW